MDSPARLACLPAAGRVPAASSVYQAMSAWFTWAMTRPTRRSVIALYIGLAVVALSVGLVTLMWYLPVPRTWWSLTIFVLALCGGPVLGGLFIGRFLREIRRAIVTRRASQHADGS